MNLKEVKTKDQFWEFADNWYQRAHRLRSVWQDEAETHERRLKAFQLWQTMTQRIISLSSIASKFNQNTKESNFKKGATFVS